MQKLSLKIAVLLVLLILLVLNVAIGYCNGNLQILIFCSFRSQIRLLIVNYCVGLNQVN